ncbi:MAG: hypothetical protein ABSD56_01535 [Bryobacteraceae bacterium]
MLVDLANTTVFRRVHNPNPAIIGARLDEFLSTIGERAQTFAQAEFCDVRFRLYDGWFDAEGNGTQLYRMVRQHIREAYPTRRRTFRAFVDVAEGPLAATGERLLDTFRIQGGLTRHHISVVAEPPAACALPRECPLAALRSWVKGRCPVPTCSVQSEEAASFHQQKLVDTALVADLVWGGSQGTKVLVVSDDEDVLPGLITARAFGATVGWTCRSDRPRGVYAPLIARHGIEYFVC